MHQLLCHTGVPNCIDKQIPIQSDLNIPLWEQALHNSRDQQLIYFLKYEFPLEVPFSVTRYNKCSQTCQDWSKIAYFENYSFERPRSQNVYNDI